MYFMFRDWVLFGNSWLSSLLLGELLNGYAEHTLFFPTSYLKYRRVCLRVRCSAVARTEKKKKNCRFQGWTNEIWNVLAWYFCFSSDVQNYSEFHIILINVQITWLFQNHCNIVISFTATFLIVFSLSRFYKNLYAFLISETPVTFSPHHIHLDLITVIAFGGEYILVSASLWLFSIVLKAMTLKLKICGLLICRNVWHVGYAIEKVSCLNMLLWNYKRTNDLGCANPGIVDLALLKATDVSQWFSLFCSVISWRCCLTGQFFIRENLPNA
jgi:hypothetical protein